MRTVRRIWRAFVQFGFHLLYNEFAFTYDTVSTMVSMGEWRCWQRATLAHLGATKSARILEVAHGTGNLQLDLSKLGYITIGYDLSPYMGRITQKKLQKHGQAPHLVRGMAQHMPFPAESFGAIVSTFPADFILVPQTLQEVHRILQAGGRLVIVPNGVLIGGGFAKASLEWLYRVTGQRDEANLDLNDLFASYGFEVITIREACPRSYAQVVVATKRD